MPPPKLARLGRIGSPLLKLGLSTVFLLLLLEGAVRFLLFSPSAAGWSVAQRLRDPGRFGRSSSDDLYWYLMGIWRRPPAPAFPPPHDSRLGWTWRTVAPGTYAHADESRLADRKPILLLGDSYSACLTPPEDCFQWLLEDSAMAGEYALLNYGISGYGFDQTYLLLREVLERHAQRQPLVIVGLLVDDDFDRALLSLREHPKPRLRVEAGRLITPVGDVPTREQYLAANPAAPASWAWALLRAPRSGIGDPRGTPAQEAEKEALARQLLREAVEELRRREVCFFFLLFHTPYNVDEPFPSDWRERAVHEELDALAAPWYEVRDDILLAAQREGLAPGDFFYPQDSPGVAHLNPAGNQAAFQTILRGLREVCGVEPGSRIPLRPWVFAASLDGNDGGVAAFQRSPNQFLPEVDDDTRLLLRAGRSEATEVRFELGGRGLRFRARVWSFDPQGNGGGATLEARVDGESRWKATLAGGLDPLPIEIDLAGARTLELIARPSEQRSGECFILSDPVFEEASDR